MSMLGAMVVAGGIGVAIGAGLMAFAIWQWRDYEALKARMLKRLEGPVPRPVPVRYGPFVSGRAGTFGVGEGGHEARRKGWL